MTLAALQHLLRAALALAEDREMIVLGSASLLVAHPRLGDPTAPLAATYVADLCPQPFDELTGTMLEEALGASQAYYRRHGYHADILRDSIFETLPGGWRSRLLPVPQVSGAFALEPHDLGAVKLWVGRPKDLQLLRNLVETNILSVETLETRLTQLTVPLHDKARLTANFKNLSLL